MLLLTGKYDRIGVIGSQQDELRETPPRSKQSHRKNDDVKHVLDPMGRSG